MKSEERCRAEQEKATQFMRDYSNPNAFKYETEIVWLYPPENFPHVRQTWSLTRHLTRPVTWGWDYSDGRLIVGYVVLRTPVYRRSRTYLRRRFFYVMPFDMDRPANWPPSEGVDPLTVAPTIAGRKTERCYQAPTPEQRAAFAAILAAQQAKRDAKRRAAAERQRRHRAPMQQRKAHNARCRVQQKSNLSG
jgi:hypothetical protein